MELGGGGEGAAAAVAGGEDRLSALPEDVLVLILRKLGTRAAAQTRVLSRRWHRIWSLLPELYLTSPPEPHRLRVLLDDHEVLLRELLVFADSATPESLAVWLPAAARRVSGVMSLKIDGPVEDAEEAARRGAFELPCFEQATKILFFLSFQGLAMPATGVFTRLTELHLYSVWFHGPGKLGDAVSSLRCPCLQRLSVHNSRGLRDLAIDSESMLSMELRDLHTLSRLAVVAPALKELTIESCFLENEPVANISAPLLMELDWDDDFDLSSVHRTVQFSHRLRDLAIHSESMLSMKLRELRGLSRLTVVAPALKELTIESCFLKSEPIANISAPLLTKLDWDDEFDSSSVHLGEMAHLQCLGVQVYLVYGEMFMHIFNESCLRLLQRFEGIETLSLPLMYPRDIENYDYMMEGMAVLPNVTFLFLMVRANGHAFGASAFHVLRLCTGIRSLKLDVAATVSEDNNTVCSSDCICVQQLEWETEELLLNHLEEVEIYGWRGTEHEIAFVKRLFDWGTKLKEMRVKFRYLSTSEVKAKDLYQTFPSFSRPGVCVKFYRDGLLYAPKD